MGRRIYGELGNNNEDATKPNGLTPSQKANIPIDLTGNRWKTMIELAKNSKSHAMQQGVKNNP